MDAAVAEAVVRATREEASRNAQADLHEMRRRAVEAGRERSRRVAKTTSIDKAAGVARYNPAGRFLRDWYFHVYINTLRSSVGQPAEAIDAQQVEDAAAVLRRLRPQAPPIRALQAVGVMRLVAQDDAVHAAAEIVDRLASVGARRAVRHAGDERFDGDLTRVHISRHWYLRCYEDQIELATRTQRPLAAVTAAEERQVAISMARGELCRLIGPDGLPLVTAHNTAMTDVDRWLAAGEVGLVSLATDSSQRINALTVLRTNVTSTWSRLSPVERSQWLRLAGAESRHTGTWSNLPGEDQSKIIRFYLNTRRNDLLDGRFRRTLIAQEPATGAALCSTTAHRLS